MRDWTDIDLGADGWMVADQPVTRAATLALVRDHRRAGEAFATANTPGRALFGAICRAAGVRPSSTGIGSAVATVLGYPGRQYVQALMTRSLDTVAREAARLGYYVVALPGDRYVVGDMPFEIAP